MALGDEQLVNGSTKGDRNCETEKGSTPENGRSGGNGDITEPLASDSDAKLGNHSVVRSEFDWNEKIHLENAMKQILTISSQRSLNGPELKVELFEELGLVITRDIRIGKLFMFVQGTKASQR